MAIRKQKQLPSGVVGEYWKITTEHFDRTTKRCTWTIALFKDQAASVAKKANMGVVKTFSAILDHDDMMSARIAVGYASIKTQANTMITPPFNPNAEPAYMDADLAEGEDL